jgi:cytochrome c553
VARHRGQAQGDELSARAAAAHRIVGSAGRPAYYTIRQLNDIKTGARKGTSVAVMQTVVAKPSDEDMVNLTAYTASRH